MDLSVIVVSHKHCELVKTYFPSILNSSSSASIEVVFIENYPDGSADWVEQNYSEVRVIRNTTSISYAANINKGIYELQRGKYVVVLNPDVRCLPGLWDVSVKFMDENSNVGILGPKLLNPDHSVQPSCRTFSTPLTLLIRGFHLDGLLKKTSIIKSYLMYDFDHNDVRDVDWITGALMIVRRKAIDDVGGMDERYKIAYSEDQDWCCRMWRAGWRVTYVPRAEAVHDHLRTGMSKPWSKMARAQLINAIRMFSKFNWKLSRY